MINFEWLNKLAERWQVKSTGQVVVILLVFGLTGFSAMFAKKIVFGWMDIDASWHWGLRFGIWMLTIFPLYQILLLFYGALLGQFVFFYRFEKKMFSRIYGILGFKNKKTED